MYHYWLKNWGDHSIPTGDIIFFIREIIKELSILHRKSTTPLVVHCKAGVGRTGSFIAIYAAIEYIVETKNKVKLDDVVKFIIEMRKRR